MTTYSANSKVQNAKPTGVFNGLAGKTNKHLPFPLSLHPMALLLSTMTCEKIWQDQKNNVKY